MIASGITDQQPSFARRLWTAARPYSYPAAIVPTVLSVAVAKLNFPNLKINIINFALLLLGSIGAQAISNLVNDLVDFKTGVDTADAPGRKSALITGAITFREMLNSVIVIGLLSAVIGIYFTILVGWPIFIIVLISGILAIEYTAPPLKLKYHALGDVAVFVSFGIAMVFGTYLVITNQQAGALEHSKLIPLALYNFPNILLVLAILHANNHRDREKDSQLGGVTVANKLSFHMSKLVLEVLVIGPYVLTLIAIGLSHMSEAAILVLLSVPLAIKIIRPILIDDYSRSVPMIAKLHGRFGFLMTVAILVQIYALSHYHV